MRHGITATFLLVGAPCLAAGLAPAAERAFERYVADLEGRLATQHANPDTYIAMLNLEPGQRTAMERALQAGGTRVEPVNGGMQGLSGALLHHWRAAAFVRNATPKDMLALLRDYSHLPTHYAPEVVSSRVVNGDGETATLAVRLKEQRVVPIVLDTEYKIHAKLDGDDRGYSISRSTSIWQIDAPGTAHERRRAAGDDDGFLWRLNSYWSFVRTPGGLLMECEAVSLTRDVPRGLGWLIAPIVEDLPREELDFTMRATKNALTANAAPEARR